MTNYSKLSTEELGKKLLELQEIAGKHEDANRIYFFDTRPRPGPNPLQAELLEAWFESNLKVFAYVGANRTGKTTILVLLALSTLFGILPWNKKKLHFRHTDARKVRIIGQDWEKHIKAVLIPELEKWWPKDRKVKTKKNNQGIDAFWVDVKTGSSLEIMCLRPDQRIIMANGYEKPIKDIKVGDLILCSEGATRVTNIFNSFSERFYKIRTFNGKEIVCSENHKIKTSKGYLKASALTCSHIAHVPEIPYAPGVETMEDWLLAIVGALLGDGKISGDNAELICFSNGLLGWLKNILPNDLKIVEIPQRGEGSYRISQVKKRNYNPIVQWLKKQGLWGIKCAERFIPEIIFEQTPEKIGIFLSGLFSTDGTFGGHQISYSSRSFRMVDDIKRLLRRIGVTASVGSYYRECFFDGYDCSGIVNVCRIGGVENIKIFSQYVNFIGKKMDWTGFSKEMISKKPSPRKEQIVSISFVEGGKCLDLEVESDVHNYFVDGLLVHNSNGQESDLHEGWSGDLVCYDEPPKRDIRVANARGLVDREGKELFAMTLLKEAWVDREVIRATLEDGRPDPTVFSVNGDIYANVGFGITLEGIRQFEKTLTDDEKSARLYGKPSYMSGLVFPQWNRKVHLKERFQIPLHWMVDVAIDVHPRERQAVLFIATNEIGVRYVCNEIWDHGNGTWVGENIVRCVKQNTYRVNRIVCDPLAKGDGNNVNTVYEKIGRVLWSHGLPLETATKDRDAGIKEIQTHLKGPNNEPSLFVFNDLVRFLYEIEGWMWDKDTQKAADKDDHMMENLYRLLLLGTKWYDMGEEEEEVYYNDGRSAIGGY